MICLKICDFKFGLISYIFKVTQNNAFCNRVVRKRFLCMCTRLPVVKHNGCQGQCYFARSIPLFVGIV